MILIEMELTNGREVEGSVMINVASISEVEETADSIRLHMVSGNSYLVTNQSFGNVLSGIEGVKYMKINRNPVAEDEVREVEGELVTE